MDASKCVTWLYQTFGKFRSKIPIGIRAGGNSAFFCLSRKDVKKGRRHEWAPTVCPVLRFTSIPTTFPCKEWISQEKQRFRGVTRRVRVSQTADGGHPNEVIGAGAHRCGEDPLLTHLSYVRIVWGYFCVCDKRMKFNADTRCQNTPERTTWWLA